MVSGVGGNIRLLQGLHRDLEECRKKIKVQESRI